jgi:Carboxypeptidase regulatory-like domain
MSKAPALALLSLLLAVGSANAQAPTGTITGLVLDASGAALAGVQVSIANRSTGQIRIATTSADGGYGAAALLPGVYTVSAEVANFKRVERAASIEAGTTTTVDLSLELGPMKETVTVPGVQPLIRSDHHQVGAVVTRAQIETLPLNGRTFLELAKLEPGVTNPARLGDGRVFVSSLGGGLQTIPRVGSTRVTLDGASISTPGTVGVLLQVSQDAVQEFQLSTVNFDQSTSLTTNGAINVVTRSGGNEYRGGGFYLYRDHRMAAYPGLGRDPRNPDPFFRRQQLGSYFGGPVLRDRLFIFGSYEQSDQRGVVSVQPRSPAFAHLGGVFPSPFFENQVSARVDTRLHSNHNAFVRYTHDRNSSFGGVTNVLPSGWLRRTNQVDQGVAALTSVLSAHLVNDIRLSYFATSTPSRPASTKDCPACFGLGEVRITITGADLTIGNAPSGSAVGNRYQVTDNLVWEKGDHRFRFGIDWEHAVSQGSSISQDPADIRLWSPSSITDPTIALPASFTDVRDIQQLPLRSFSTSVGPTSPIWSGFREQRVTDLLRVYAGDTWRVAPRLTINLGLGWSYEPNALNHDLTKPALLTALLGPDRLNAPIIQTRTFSPTGGFAWTATRDSRTVVRGGAGLYFDPANSTNANNLITERHLLSPLGTGRLTETGLNILHNSHPLDFTQATSFTGAQLLSMLPGIRANLLASLNPGNRDFSVRNIDLTKQGQNVYDPSYAMPYAVHANAGVQRELGPGFVVSADLVWKRFVHTFINGIDYNRWIAGRGGVPTTAVIAPCTEGERHDVSAVCSNGRIYFDTTIGRARYLGLLVRAEKRFSGRGQFLVSYAIGSFVGTNGTGTGTSEAPGRRVFGFNNDDWFENYGPLPTDQRHELNLSTVVELRWQLQIAVNVSAYSAPPFSPYVAGLDFNGDGTQDDLLPGTKVNQFGRGFGKGDLARLVDAYNQQRALRSTTSGQTAPLLKLPDSYSFYDSFFTQDVRVTRTFPVGIARARLSAFVEIFNLLNTSNLLGHGANLVDPSFGQPNERVGQAFGSGGPRAFQFGARFFF